MIDNFNENKFSIKRNRFNHELIIFLKAIKYIYILAIFILFLVLCFMSNNKKIDFKSNKENKIYLDKYDVGIFYKIKETLENSNCSLMWDNQKEFLNGVVRKFRPKKILEIGVDKGGSSVIILNAINDIKDSHLYSIDLSTKKKIGKCVKLLMPHLLNKWTLFTGNVAANFMEQVGNDIDMVLIDSAHFEPGEILDFLIVLPFLKEEAIVGFHDIGNQITKAGKKGSRKEWAPYLIFNIIRGKKFLPSGDKILTHDIGAIKLEKNQFKFIHDYFRALGGQWQYFPKESHVEVILELFKKYYDDDCIFMFNEAVKFNRKFVRNNPMKVLYKSNIEKDLIKEEN